MIHLACLYGPLLGAGMLAWWLRPSKRFATGLLFSFAWTAALLPWLDGIARLCGMWSYHSGTVSIGGMPLALYFGWAIAWGLFAPLLSRALGGRIWVVTGLLLAIDLRVMPEMKPVLELSSLWWIGELVVVMLLLVPALFMATWTESRSRIGLRCVMLAPSFGGIFLGIPLMVECGDLHGMISLWETWHDIPKTLFLLGFMAFSIPGLAALQDLALSGDGTPVPLDPPRKLVTHGIYAFVRNPMQMSMTSLLLLESLFLMSPWPAVLALLGVVYSEGLARWSENEDMRQRFGDDWTRYQASVRPWLPRWSPRIGEPCELWLNADCGLCCEVARWFENHRPHQLVLRDAADWQGTNLQRVTWHHPSSGRTESGVRAIAMSLQHLHLGWAIVGWFAGLPLISHIIQICFDAAGGGKIKGRPVSSDRPSG